MTTTTLTIDDAFRQAVSHHQAARLQDAERLYQAILQAKPDHSDANHNMGVLAVQVGKPVVSLPYFKSALEADVGRQQFWLSYGEALLSSGQVPAADALMRDAVSRGYSGKPFEALRDRILNAKRNPVGYAISCVKSGRPIEAEGILSSHLRTHANDGQALAQYGELIRHQPGRESEAAGILEKATQKWPGHFMPWLSYGSVLNQLGRIEEAKNAFLKALSLSQNLVEAANDLGSIYVTEKNWPEACVMFERAARLAPNAPAIHLNLARVYAQLHNFDAAESAARRALPLLPEEEKTSVHMFLASIGRESVPDQIPGAFLQNLYASRAQSWDNEVQETDNGYRGHLMVASAFKDYATDKLSSILDVGCGTGLVGELVVGMANQLDGIDLSKAMLDVAAKKSIYNNLYCGDVIFYSKNSPSRYDAILSAATLIHFGDLKPILISVYSSLKERGVFVFTFFPFSGDADFSVMPDGRGVGGCFSHNPKYLSSLSSEVGFNIKSLREEIHEYNGRDPIIGIVAVLEKAPLNS